MKNTTIRKYPNPIRLILLITCLLTTSLSIAQTGNNELNQDIDGDGKLDKIFFNTESDNLEVLLSSKNNYIIQSDVIDGFSGVVDIVSAKNGFIININSMRSGNALQYRYEAKTQKIRLIGISTYSFGPASNDGSGEASTNLLTNRYIGEWHYYDDKKEELIKLPTIKARLSLPKTYLGKPQDSAIEQFFDKNEALHNAARKKYERSQ